ncbi:hypothetical protein BV25DRAFT_1852962, partial [Artomyces pyxidatus]
MSGIPPTAGRSPSPGADRDYGDPSAKLWSVYLGVADNFDKVMVESWKGDMDGILIFTGLFSASVSAFVIESYRSLQQDSGVLTVQLLSQISQQLAGGLNASQLQSYPSTTPFQPSNSTLRVNIFWFLSLVLSVSCALCAILVQQWSRRYLRMVQRPSAPYRRARIREYLYNGVVRFRLVQVTESIPVLLHASVFLFFAGLVQFLFTVNAIVAYVILAAISIAAAVYSLFTILPMIANDSPYQTALSAPLWYTVQGILIPVFSFGYLLSNLPAPLPMLRFDIGLAIQACIRRVSAGLTHGLWDHATRASTAHASDTRALSWLTRSMYDDSELGPFIEGIPGFLRSLRTRDAPLTLRRLMLEQGLGRRIATMLIFCIDASGLPPEPRVHRALAGLHAVWA